MIVRLKTRDVMAEDKRKRIKGKKLNNEKIVEYKADSKVKDIPVAHISMDKNIPEAGVHAARSKNISNVHIILLTVFIALVAINQLLIFGVSGFSVGTTTSRITYDDVIPKGVPAVYGSELGVSYDDVSPNDAQLADQTIRKLSVYDNGITLSGDDLQRYISIVSQISCEYCCGAQSIIFNDGKSACGCAHSAAMRGLAKYMIKNHPDATDDAVLEELGKWKTLFFPSALSQKAQILKEKGIEINYINLASNKYRGIEKGAASGGGSMVGGC